MHVKHVLTCKTFYLYLYVSYHFSYAPYTGQDAYYRTVGPYRYGPTHTRPCARVLVFVSSVCPAAGKTFYR